MPKRTSRPFFCLRLAPDDRERLRRLVALEREGASRASLSASEYLRVLIRREEARILRGAQGA